MKASQLQPLVYSQCYPQSPELRLEMLPDTVWPQVQGPFAQHLHLPLQVSNGKLENNTLLEGMDLQYFEGMDIFAVTKSDRTIIA